jgi:phosphate uptake regulator
MINIIYSAVIPIFMRRKVIRQGHNTLTITLPSRWARDNGVKPGDELELHEEAGEVVISRRLGEHGRKAEIRVMKPSRLISRSIFNLYRTGYDEIKVAYDDPIIIKDIYGYMPLLMGFEITSQCKDSTTLKNVLNIDESQFESSLRRYFLITKTLSEECLNAIRQKRYDDLMGISELELAQNRLYMFLSRCVNKVPGLVKRPTLMYLMIQRLEDIADDYKYLCQYVAQARVILSVGTIKQLARINSMLDMLYRLYYSFDLSLAQDIINCKKDLTATGLTMLEKAPRKEIRFIHIMNNLVVKIFEAESPIFGMRDV